jgi:hypothetical protein
VVGFACVAAASVVAGCAFLPRPDLAAGSVVDGFVLGDEAECVDNPTAVPCAGVSIAQVALDRDVPAHAPIASARVFGWMADRNEPAGRVYVVVFGLADGARHAEALLCSSTACSSWSRPSSPSP